MVNGAEGGVGSENGEMEGAWCVFGDSKLE